ncbi:MAG: O-methyltransferase [Actinomycetaceae bacterium]|nr:O-methyltransferase [Actinomycetaceae bacterium]
MDQPTVNQGGTMAADKAQSWVYAEDFVPERDVVATARAAAIDLGADPVSPGIGATLRMVAAVSGAKAVLELGTGAGVSGLWLLDGMPSDGVLTTIDNEVEFQKHARRAFLSAGVSSQRTRLIAGRALDVLPRMAARGYDLMVIDADVSEAPEYLDHAVRILRPGGVLVFVHALWHDQVADPARRDPKTVVVREVVRYFASSEEFIPSLLPIGDGVVIAVKR